MLGCLLLAPAGVCAQQELPTGIWGRPVDRSGFHFQLSFGAGGGPDSAGLFHAMEIGGTLRSGYTLGILHTFIQNRGIFGTTVGGPDLFGGWFFLFKAPLGSPDVVGKLAFGPGGIHDQSDGIQVHGSVGWSYGIDWHFPVWPTSGPTLTLAGLHALALGQHHFGMALSLGWTWF